MADEQAGERVYTVVVNDEEQYSIWWADRALPTGWRAEGVPGTRAACLEHIDRAWTDMRPLSLRRQQPDRTKEPRHGNVSGLSCSAQSLDR